MVPRYSNDMPLPAGTEKDHDMVERSSNPMVASFAALWEAKRGDAEMPDRDDFPIEELAAWFGHIIIMDVLEGGADFRYRLIGTAITRFLNRDYTGRTILGSDYSGARGKVFDTFHRPVATGGPVYREGHVAWAVDKTWRTYQSVHCPITHGGGDVAMTIGVLYFGLEAVTGPNGMRWQIAPQDR